MIQRIQSLWLFIAAMLNGLLFILPIYSYGDNPVTTVQTAQHIQLLLMAALATLLPLVAIFLFGHRSRQKGMVWIGILASLGYFGLVVLEVQNQRNSNPAVSNYQYSLGILVTLVAVVFMIMALRGIRRDDKLIRSLDRLR